MLFQRLLIMAAGGLLLFCSVSSALAAEVTISPMAGAYVFDDNRGLKNSPVYSLGLGLNFDQHWSVEGTADYVETERDGSDTTLNFYSGRLGILYHFVPIDNLTPYALLGAGVLRFNGNDDGQVTYGLGVKLGISDRADLRFEARHVLGLDINKDYDIGGTYNDFAFNVGFVFTLGSLSESQTLYQGQEDKTAQPELSPMDVPEAEHESAILVAPEATKTVEDGDNDGVIDVLDRCPVTPLGTLVDSEGCPESVKFVDSDGDGVSDVLDACPDTLKSSDVDVRGCPLSDTDGDGVSDVNDQCAGTDPQLPVDQYGCPELSEKLKIAGLVIEYATSQTGFSEEAARELKLLAGKVLSTDQGRLAVEGHTDSTGNETYNFTLSKERAEKVRQALISDFAVPAERVVARGFGPSDPVADNTTQEGRQQNRRVIVRYEP